MTRAQYIYTLLCESFGSAWKGWLHTTTGDAYDFAPEDVHARVNPETHEHGRRDPELYERLLREGWAAIYFLFGEPGARLYNVDAQKLQVIQRYFLDRGVHPDTMTHIEDLGRGSQVFALKDIVPRRGFRRFR